MTGRNLDLLAELVPQGPAVIVEIGICQYKEWESSSKILISRMHRDSRYVGMDIDDRSYLKARFPDKNVEVIRVDTGRQAVGMEPIDLLYIDGDHTPQGVSADWTYARYVKPGGLVVLHDTNWHAGPRLLYEAVDETLFEKQLHFDGMKDDFGMAVLRRKDA